MGLDPGTLGGDAGTQTIWDAHKGTEAHQVVCPFSPLQIFVPHTWVHNFLQDGFKHVSKYQRVNKNMFGNKRPIRCKTTS